MMTMRELERERAKQERLCAEIVRLQAELARIDAEIERRRAPGLEHDEQSAAYAEAVNAGNPPTVPRREDDEGVVRSKLPDTWET